MTHTRASIAAGYILAAGLVASVVLANYLTTEYGFIPVDLGLFGLMATAGTLAAGLVLGLRDLVHDLAGRTVMLAVIAVGAGVSFLVADPTIALASGTAFLVAELIDYGVYVPIRRRAAIGDMRWSAAVLGSNAVGALVDTVVFLSIAFGIAAVWDASTISGQMVGKAWATLSLIAAVWALRWITRALLREPVHVTDR